MMSGQLSSSAKKNSVARKQFGYSLVELLIVVAIVGIIAAIAVPSYSKFQKNNYRSRASTALAEIRSALITYQAMRTDGTLTGYETNPRYMAKIAYLDDSRINYRYTYTLTDLNDGRFYLTMAPVVKSGQQGDGVLVVSVSGDVCRFTSTDSPANLSAAELQQCQGGERI